MSQLLGNLKSDREGKSGLSRYLICVNDVFLLFVWYFHKKMNRMGNDSGHILVTGTHVLR